jgi:predicted phage terminase large subunit-like protein
VVDQQLEDFAVKEDPPSRGEMQELDNLVAHARPEQLFSVEEEFRSAAVRRVVNVMIDKTSSKREVLRAGQTLATFERVNLQARQLGYTGATDNKVLGTEGIDLDPDFTRFARWQAVLHSQGKRCSQSKAVHTATPLTFATFASGGDWKPAKHLLYLDDRICRLIDGANQGKPGAPRIILVDAPPRHGKSQYCSRWLPSWFVGKFPHRSAMLASYSDAFSRHWGKASKEVVKEYGRHYFNIGIDSGTRAGNEWKLDSTPGGMITSGIGGSFTGRGAHLLLVDDPIKNAEEAISETVRKAQWEWWQSTAWTRLEPGGVAVVIMTRWHKDDLAGKIEQWGKQRGVGVERISFPAYAHKDDILGRKKGEALWPERMPLKELKLREDMLDAYWFSAMYDGNPGSYGQTEWPAEYFDGLLLEDGETWPGTFEWSVIALDPSKGAGVKKGDYSSFSFVGISGGKVWVDVDISRRPVPQIAADGVRFAEDLGCDVFGIESNAFQDLLAGPFDEASRDYGTPPLPITGIMNTSNKALRISRLGPWLKRKKLRLRPSQSAHLLIQQLKDFPFGDHDDGPDSLEMALRLLRQSINIDPHVPQEVNRI